ncbi:phosphomannomutase/phosphoglucomutase, partial [bacterium]|nr:phosphomannomutase/phosphoglucomutase [bacterium]
MILNPKIFKAYDIRGIYKQDLDEKLAYELGLAFIYLMNKEKGDGKKTIAVSGDARISTPSLKNSLIKGITDAGADVLDIGQLSTPSFYFGVSYFNCDGGIIVSASHNPKEWNGFKLTRDKAKPISGETGINELKKIISSKKALKSTLKGEVIKTDKTLEAHINHAFKFFNPKNIKPLKVVVDPANGMGSQYTEKMFEKLSCDLIKMNFKIDGTFPVHEADPIKEENLIDLKNKVLEEGADLGIAIDGDGDRVFFIDNEGKTINQATIRGILSKIFLK